MSQKKIEEQQRKILFDHFKAGTLERKMDTAYKKKKPAKLAETAEPAKPAESAKPAKSVPYDYEFDFKYLLGNYYKAYRNDKYYNDMKNDMKDECAEIKEEIKELEREAAHDPILLWYIYEKIDENKKKVKLFDCDSWNGSNDLMDEIYDRLWRNKMDKSLRDKFGGDTMNSFATTFNAFSGEESYEKTFCAYKKDIKSIESEENKEGEENKENKENKEREEKKKKKEKKKFYDALRKYAKLTGCLGNFVLVPKGFSGYRGPAGTIRDYWDLSLHELRCDRSGQGWLDLVDMPFNKYINLFFLWDYVSGQKNEGYRAWPLFKSHEAILTREKMVLPRKAGPPKEDRKRAFYDFSEFTKNANRCILRRGAFMSAMLRISVECPHSYKRIVEYLATDASLGSMEDVIDQLQALPLGRKGRKAKGFLSELSKELKKIERSSKKNT